MPIVRTVQPDGDTIRALRVRRGLSLRNLGAMIGRHGQTIRNLELSNRLASEVLINQIANALGVDVNELIKPEEDATDEPGARAAAA